MILLTGPRCSGNHAVRAMFEAAGLVKRPGMFSGDGGRLAWSERKRDPAAWRPALPAPGPDEFLNGHAPPSLLPRPAILILRNPFATAVGWWEREGRPVTFHYFLKTDERFFATQRPFYLPAERARALLVVHYERLRDPRTVARLAAAVGRPLHAGPVRPPSQRWRNHRDLLGLFMRRWRDVDGFTPPQPSPVKGEGREGGAAEDSPRNSGVSPRAQPERAAFT
jgi:hypothetical protein